MNVVAAPLLVRLFSSPPLPAVFVLRTPQSAAVAAAAAAAVAAVAAAMGVRRDSSAAAGDDARVVFRGARWAARRVCDLPPHTDRERQHVRLELLSRRTDYARTTLERDAGIASNWKSECMGTAGSYIRGRSGYDMLLGNKNPALWLSSCPWIGGSHAACLKLISIPCRMQGSKEEVQGRRKTGDARSARRTRASDCTEEEVVMYCFSSVCWNSWKQEIPCVLEGNTGTQQSERTYGGIRVIRVVVAAPCGCRVPFKATTYDRYLDG